VNKGNLDDLSGLSMLELFRVEAETQAAALTNGLLELERGVAAPEQLETLMRAAHSLKGAARIVNLQVAVRVAHAMEDCFVAAQNGKIHLQQAGIDVLFRGVDLLQHISKRTEANIGSWETDHAAEISAFLESISKLMAGAQVEAQSQPDNGASASESGADELRETAASETPLSESLPAKRPQAQPQKTRPPSAGRKDESTDRVLRLTAENLNRLLGLAGESLVESRWLRPFAASLERLKRHHADLSHKIEVLRENVSAENSSPAVENHLSELLRQVAECQHYLAERLQELDLYDRRSAHLSHRLYLEVLRTRMRPFADGTRRFPRMVRDLARSLGKEVRLEILGENTQVDRDILDRLETPLAHLLRNAIDHGCETCEARQAAGKSAEGVIRLEARHSAGMLVVTVSDDGAGLDPERLRNIVVQKKLTMPAVADKLSEPELLEFLFLPGFTLKETVTEISGRGVGLDVVQNMVKNVRGSIRVTTQPGQGMRFQLQLPLTLSVLRTLLIEVSGEPYAIPLSQIIRTLKLPREKIEALEGRHHFQFGDQQVGLLTAHQVLGYASPKAPTDELPVVVLGDRTSRYGLVVDRFLGQRELVVQPLDSRLGKVKDISAAALMEDGSPVLIVDVDDLMRSVEKLISGGGVLAKVEPDDRRLGVKRAKRVLAVDDSLTVRELERKLLTNRGFVTDVAVDGMDGWNAVRSGQYDLVITDVDMPRMDGIELAKLIKNDPHLKSLPVMIVSYKDREEDRMRGLEAGADYYLTKGSFHDETLLQAVVDLIGEPDS
jgi:two-component system sensor histidine kinase and response regulator WspE